MLPLARGALRVLSLALLCRRALLILRLRGFVLLVLPILSHALLGRLLLLTLRRFTLLVLAIHRLALLRCLALLVLSVLRLRSLLLLTLVIA